MLIVMSEMPDITDYYDFKNRCESQNLYLCKTIEYAHCVGMIIVGQRLFPGASRNEIVQNLYNLSQTESRPEPIDIEKIIAQDRLTQVKRFGKALKGWVKAGLPTRSKEEVERILNICRGCETAKKVMFGMIQCSAVKGGCSCFVNAKGRMETEKCPKGKW